MITADAIAMKIGDIEEYLCDHYDDIVMDTDPIELVSDIDMKIVSDGPCIAIQSLGFKVYPAILCSPDDASEWNADASVTVVIDAKTDEVLYWESDDIVISLANFMNSISEKYYDLGAIQNLDCKVIL
jgi:hypothetical protein